MVRRQEGQLDGNGGQAQAWSPLLPSGWTAGEAARWQGGEEGSKKVGRQEGKIEGQLGLKWFELEWIAGQLDRRSDAAQNTRRWADDFNLVGLVGEHVYAREAGIPFNPWAKLWRDGLNDGGEDFPGVDVKATKLQPPLLTHVVGTPFKARNYALVSVDLKHQTGEYLGWATAEMLEAGKVRDLGHGPRQTLKPSELLRGFPR